MHLWDGGLAEPGDLSAQFCLGAGDLGQPRAGASAAALQQLNSAVEAKVLGGALLDNDLSGYGVVVLCGALLSESLAISDHLRALPGGGPSLVRGESRGVFGSVFCDFGESHTVTDTDGEEPHLAILSSVGSQENVLVTCVEDERIQFQEGDLVELREVRGMTELNGGRFRVTDTKAYSFRMECDTTGMSPYEGGGIAVQVKEPKEMSFKPLRAALEEPGEFLVSDFAKLERPGQLHWAFRALDVFHAAHGRLPAPGSEADAAALVGLARGLWEAADGAHRLVDELDAKVLTAFAKTCRGNLSPTAAVLGGVIAQEALKACTGKFTPVNQWLYFDAMEALPEPIPAEAEMATDALPQVLQRYAGNIACLGRALQEKMLAQKVFVVGAGALGCEFLKAFALLGVSCGEGGGGLRVTDDDTIEKSNLSRQFLFRTGDVGKAKSTVAVAAARAMNPAFNAEGMVARVSPETESTFNCAFWDGLDLVVNALDNVNARLYVDSKCVYHRKPLLESGTLGTKCNTQVVSPAQTENYGASRDPPEKQIAMCTLHSFPHNSEHCLAWGRSEFEGLLARAPAEANRLMGDPAAFFAEMEAAKGDAGAKEAGQLALSALSSPRRCTVYEDCLNAARALFQEWFYDKVVQLTRTFPEDAVTSSGAKFWSAPKRFPKPLEFNPADEATQAFTQAAARLLAEVNGVDIPAWAQAKEAAAQCAQEAAKFTPPPPAETAPVLPKDGAPEGAPTAPAAADPVDGVEQLRAQLEGVVAALNQGMSSDLKLAPVSFEKDDDSNGHMQLIWSLSNLRARNYSIEEVDFLRAKLVAGRIIPAIATTTAAATGLVGLELLKLLQGKKLEELRNTFANLALPLFAMAEPMPCKNISHEGQTWTLWDRWELPDLLFSELMAWFRDRKLTPYSVSCGSTLLYSSIFPKHAERLKMKISEVALKAGRLAEGADRLDVVVACEDDDGEDVDVPLVTIRLG